MLNSEIYNDYTYCNNEITYDKYFNIGSSNEEPTLCDKFEDVIKNNVMEQCKEYLTNPEYVYASVIGDPQNYYGELNDCRKLVVLKRMTEMTKTNENRSDVKNIDTAKHNANMLYVEKIIDYEKLDEYVVKADCYHYQNTIDFIEGQIVCDEQNFDPDNYVSKGITFYRTIEPAFYERLSVCDFNREIQLKKWYPNGQMMSSIEINKDKYADIYKTYRKWSENAYLKAIMHFDINGLATGSCQEWSEDGYEITKLNFVDGRFHGLQETWILSDEPKPIKKFEATLKHGAFDGKITLWNNSGNIIIMTEYKNGLYHGLRKLYYNNRVLWTRTNYKNNTLDNLNEVWYENGDVKIIENYKNGRLHGLYREKYIGNKKKIECEYVDGKKHGCYCSWHENGIVHITTNYEADEYDGPYQSWYENGKQHIVTYHKKGVCHGRYAAYHENGYESEIKFFDNGVLNGYYTKSGKDNRPLKMCKYVNGKKHGFCQKFIKGTHDMKKDVTYINGKKDGVYRKWYKTGVLKKEADYKNGEVLSYKEWNKDSTLKCDLTVRSYLPCGWPLIFVAIPFIPFFINAYGTK